ncbi:YbhB/YbcL family Raf kinase inhibitor-like protein [Schaalia sp. lx-260]|uniref:YbhB/YbcL family Raf kinase inhibitor-like protein n=1 Tax=Schaalia sp. lx-260 TaxID=2899082 RepID=UPI001E35092A|nr:YbhB/YbcL family Raf kinase inhibitor-like protein [Schaalia sp. lx-260]MCD4550377.1 YbhB/YbcL family Raf kinase inhibitor-like protein [Schaalia sp. lx-260]
MDLSARPQAIHPDIAIPCPTSFKLTSPTLIEGEFLPTEHTADGGNISPQLRWENPPVGTESFLLTCFDPDAPTPSGWWHWCVVDIDASVYELVSGAGASDLELEGAAFHLRADHGEASYFGAAPPKGDREHRYVFTLYALDVPTLHVDDEASIAMAIFLANEHVLGRASITVFYQQK